jgi:hypothetical protein
MAESASSRADMNGKAADFPFGAGDEHSVVSDGTMTDERPTGVPTGVDSVMEGEWVGRCKRSSHYSRRFPGRFLYYDEQDFCWSNWKGFNIHRTSRSEASWHRHDQAQSDRPTENNATADHTASASTPDMGGPDDTVVADVTADADLVFAIGNLSRSASRSDAAA